MLVKKLVNDLLQVTFETANWRYKQSLVNITGNMNLAARLTFPCIIHICVPAPLLDQATISST